MTARGRAKRVQDVEAEVDRRQSPQLKAWQPLIEPEAGAKIARDFLEAVANAGAGPEAEAAGREFLDALAELEGRQHQHQPEEPPHAD